jgi:hypothetical protein
MYTFNEQFTEYSAFFTDTTKGYDEINTVLERIVTHAEYLIEKYGGLEDDDEADEYQNAQLAQLRIIQRDMAAFARNCGTTLAALKNDLDSKIDFAEAMLEGMGVKTA